MPGILQGAGGASSSGNTGTSQENNTSKRAANSMRCRNRAANPSASSSTMEGDEGSAAVSIALASVSKLNK